MLTKESKIIEIDRKPLFLINFKSKWENNTYMATQDTIDFQRKWWHGDTTVIEEIGVPEVECEITLVGINTRRCYVEHWYEVRSKKELSDNDFAILRAWRCFMQGQVFGKVHKKIQEDNGEWCYTVQSECDSGD